MACDKSPLVAAGFLFLGFSAAPPCTVGRLLPFPNSGFHGFCTDSKNSSLVGCSFDGVAFYGFLRILRILTEL